MNVLTAYRYSAKPNFLFPVKIFISETAAKSWEQNLPGSEKVESRKMLRHRPNHEEQRILQELLAKIPPSKPLSSIDSMIPIALPRLQRRVGLLNSMVYSTYSVGHWSKSDGKARPQQEVGTPGRKSKEKNFPNWNYICWSNENWIFDLIAIFQRYDSLAYFFPLRLKNRGK
jgi:hypothetical protein